MLAAQALLCPHVLLYGTAQCDPRRWPAVSRRYQFELSSSTVLKTKDALDLLVMTGLSFDAQGHRLGRGGG